MKTMRCTFEMEIDVQFEKPEASEAYFVSGDWKNHFHEVADLEAVAEALSNGFHHETDKWDADAKCWSRFVEGFGRFLTVKDQPNAFRTDDKTAEFIGGHILVRYESELDHAGTYEV